MVWAEATWLERLLGCAVVQTPASPAPLEVLHELWQQVAAKRKSGLEAADPDARITYAYSGGTATNTVAEIVLHFTSHAHFHRGQLASQMRLLGLQPPSAHLIGFFRL
ncbi:DinB family protein [Meiothermus taiwanensis WR-220]|uniref:DinB family protein n=3 Tax=Meiothermus taiwanensis TaxID=172827 RepID=A0A399E579_9DEIN|nr:DinB family protein [Meiothermus taiwanensis WR-220]RIH78409.1 DinB family protein [Meiothermus taiwanensis]